MNVIGEGDVLVAFHAAVAAIEGVHKSEEADMGRYQVRYASLNAVHAEVERVCELHRLIVCQEPTVRDGMFAVVTTLVHEDGSRLEFEPMCLPLPKEAQALGSATTYLRRYSLTAQFGIAVEDDDGAAATVAASVQPGRRTEAERMIRESVAQMDEPTRQKFQADFKQEFRCTLTDLPANVHARASTWARAWTPPAAPESAPEDAVDKEWVEAARGADTTP